MKINLLLDNPTGTINGYKNIDPLANGTDERIVGDIHNLDWLADNSECEEIIAKNILEYYATELNATILTAWIKKIRRGGRFVFEQLDLDAVCEAYVRNDITFAKMRELLFGEQNKSWNMKKSALTIQILTNFLEGSGFTIQLKRFENLSFCIVATRD